MAQITRAAVRAHPFEILVAESATKIPIDRAEFFEGPGQQHYRLLSYLAHQFNGQTIIDIGTHKGSSAAALSTNPKNHIHSFDIERKVPLSDLSNCTFHLANLWDPATRRFWAPTILGAALIVLDIDPHDGFLEMDLYKWLRDNNYRGLVVCDDIWYFKGMRDSFWFEIPTEHKLDITALGHWSGTGVIAFEPQYWVGSWETFQGLQVPGARRPSGTGPWTVVTAYFDLTRMSDASPAIKARDRRHYFQSARATFALDQPLVVYCDPDAVEELRALRPERLMSKTRFIPVDFETLPLTRYRNLIAENRKRHPSKDPRNTPSYYLLCMARYALIKRTIVENPFGSTHFAWLNICIERMGFKNVAHLDDVFLGPPRDKVSTAYINYIPHIETKNPAFYFANGGRCSLCSGFFTGRAQEFREFCDKVEAQFMKYLEAGHGHADEQLFSPVYFENRHLFDLYFGDYQQMITNYRATHENPEITIENIVKKSFAAGDRDTCAAACCFLMRSAQEGWLKFSNEQLTVVGSFLVHCVQNQASGATAGTVTGDLVKKSM
jgi:hypothetical protein